MNDKLFHLIAGTIFAIVALVCTENLNADVMVVKSAE
jgi:hypothetical protein